MQKPKRGRSVLLFSAAIRMLKSKTTKQGYTNELHLFRAN